MTRWSARTASASGIIVLSLLAVTECIPPVAEAAESRATTHTNGYSTLKRLAMLDISVLADFVMLDTRALGSFSDGVVTGTLVDWIVGDMVRALDGTVYGSALFAQIEVDRVVMLADGIALDLGDLISTMSPAPASAVDLLPIGLTVAAYIDVVPTYESPAESDSPTVATSEPVIGSRVDWVLQTQGLIVVDPDDPSYLIWPMLATRKVGTLDDALPGGRLVGW
jgi:hypothetical protein